MNKTIAGLLAVFLTLPCFGEEQSPSVNETEQWITQTYGEGTGFDSCTTSDSGEHRHCIYTEYSVAFGDASLRSSSGCHAYFFTWNRTVHDGHIADDKRGNETLSFELKDIDPSTITILAPAGKRGETASVGFRTINDADIMQLTSEDERIANKVFKRHACCSAGVPGIEMKSEYAPRFIKAFKHAVELCGGRASPF